MLRDKVIRHALEEMDGAVADAHSARTLLRCLLDRGEGGLAAMGERHAALAWLVEAGNAIEDGGLAGAVRPDQRGDVAGLGGEGQVIHRHEATKAHRQMLDAQERLASHPWPSFTRSEEMDFRSLRNTVGSRVETSPRGR